MGFAFLMGGYLAHVEKHVKEQYSETLNLVVSWALIKSGFDKKLASKCADWATQTVISLIVIGVGIVIGAIVGTLFFGATLGAAAVGAVVVLGGYLLIKHRSQKGKSN